MQEQDQSRYYRGSEADQYTFYRLTKALFTNARYKSLSDGAKILYGLMLDRMGLSTKNGWLDESGRVYIYFTLEEVQEYMNCHRDKGMKLLAELDTEKGTGLIERVKQGLGKPAIIYVKKFMDEADLQRSIFPTSGGRKRRSLDVGKTDPNNKKLNNTDISDTEYQSIHQPRSPQKPDGEIEKMDSIDTYRKIIHGNISYPVLCKRCGTECMNEIVAVLLDAVCSTKRYLRVDGENKPAEIVKNWHAPV